MKNYFIPFLILASSAASAQVQTEYYSNGKKSSEGNYLAGGKTQSTVIMASDGSSRPNPNLTKEGKWSYWYDSGVVSAEESYIAGTTSGVWKTWYPDGVQSSEINYTTGTARFWYPNGKKQSEGGMLPNRVFNGKWISWHDNGVKSYEGNYKDGKKDMDWNWYDAAGKQTLKETYKNDVLIDSQKF